MARFKLIRDDGSQSRSEVMFQSDNLAEVARFADEKSGRGFGLDLGVEDLGFDGHDLL